MLKTLKDEDFIITVSPLNELVEVDKEFLSGNYHKENIINPVTWTSGSVSGSAYSIILDRPSTGEYKNKLFTVSYGFTTASAMYSASFDENQNTEKLKIYKLFAKKLLGDHNQIFKFNNAEKHELIFLSFYRNLYKDEIIDNGSIEVTTITSGAFSSPDPDNNVLTSEREMKEYPGGAGVFLRGNLSGSICSICFLKSGIFVVDPNSAIGTSSTGGNFWSGSLNYEELAKSVSGSNLNDLLFGIRHRFEKVRFNNQSNIRSTFIDCKAGSTEFNYSSNPSFRKPDGTIRVVSGSTQNLLPTTYITTVGLYNKNKELLAIGKTNKPIKKNPKTDITITVRLNY